MDRRLVSMTLLQQVSIVKKCEQYKIKLSQIKVCCSLHRYILVGISTLLWTSTYPRQKIIAVSLDMQQALAIQYVRFSNVLKSSLNLHFYSYTLQNIKKSPNLRIQVGKEQQIINHNSWTIQRISSCFRSILFSVPNSQFLTICLLWPWCSQP